MVSTSSGMTELISRFGDSHCSCWEAKPGLSPKRLSRRITFGAKVDGIGLVPTAQSPSFHRNKCFTALPEGVALNGGSFDLSVPIVSFVRFKSILSSDLAEFELEHHLFVFVLVRYSLTISRLLSTQRPESPHVILNLTASSTRR